MDIRQHLQRLIGADPAVSEWITLGQPTIDAFADLTGDWQFIHTDPARAAQTPFGGTVAHGFLTLSMLSQLFERSAMPIPPSAHSVNYGFDHVRFVAPVPAGSRIRGQFSLSAAEWRPDGRVLLRIKAEVQVQGSPRPALVADWLALMTYSD